MEFKEGNGLLMPSINIERYCDVIRSKIKECKLLSKVKDFLLDAV